MLGALLPTATTIVSMIPLFTTERQFLFRAQNCPQAREELYRYGCPVLQFLMLLGVVGEPSWPNDAHYPRDAVTNLPHLPFSRQHLGLHLSDRKFRHPTIITGKYSSGATEDDIDLL